MRCLDAWMRREASSRCLIVSLRTEFSLGMRQLYTLLSACCVGLGRCVLLRIALPRGWVNRPLLVAATCPSARGWHEGGSLPYHQDRSSEAEQWPKRQGEANPESEFDRKEGDREHRSGAPTTPQKPSRHDLQPTDAQERHEQRNGGSYADSLKWPSTVRRKPEERPDLTGPREIPDRVGARHTETESQDDAEDRGEPHHRLGCGVRSTRSYGSYSFRRVGCLLSNTGRHRRLTRGRFGKLYSLWYPIHRQSRCGFYPTGAVEQRDEGRGFVDASLVPAGQSQLLDVRVLHHGRLL